MNLKLLNPLRLRLVMAIIITVGIVASCDNGPPDRERGPLHESTGEYQGHKV
ncbi:MAG: hypothetical protein KBC50_02380 [Candidatus Pacebacteria bacterium]|nr:hypothetical protein [Candidatus Paceibacterota bacterium]